MKKETSNKILNVITEHRKNTGACISALKQLAAEDQDVHEQLLEGGCLYYMAVLLKTERTIVEGQQGDSN